MGQNPTTCSAPACLLPPAADIRRGAGGIVLMISKMLDLHRNAGDVAQLWRGGG
jgi:hypothetical protein